MGEVKTLTNMFRLQAFLLNGRTCNSPSKEHISHLPNLNQEECNAKVNLSASRLLSQKLTEKPRL